MPPDGSIRFDAIPTTQLFGHPQESAFSYLHHSRETGAMGTESARAALAAWRDEFPADAFTSDPQLRALLARVLPPDRLRALEDSASAFAHQITLVIAPMAARYEQRSHLPELARYNPSGEGASRCLRPLLRHRRCRCLGERTGGSIGQSGTAYEQATLLYLLSLKAKRVTPVRRLAPSAWLVRCGA